MANTAITLSEFRRKFSEFRNVSDDSIELAIEEATSEMSQDVWAELYSVGMGQLVAHKLSVRYEDPQDPNLSNYKKEYHRLMKKVTSGYRVA